MFRDWNELERLAQEYDEESYMLRERAKLRDAPRSWELMDQADAYSDAARAIRGEVRANILAVRFATVALVIAAIGAVVAAIV